MKTIAIANHKGGVAKSSTTHALGTVLSTMGYRVLLVDVDPQSSLTNSCDVEAPGASIAEVFGSSSAGTLTIAEILVDVADVEGAVVHLAPSDIALAMNELGLVQRLGRENILRKALAAVAPAYDLCLIDCPPNLGMLTLNALAAADGVIIPTQPQISDLRGLKLFLDTIARVRQEIAPQLEILGVLVTFADPRLIHHQQAIEALVSQDVPLFETQIGRSIKVAEASAAGESIVTYDPSNRQAAAYRSLAQEVDQWLRNAPR